MIDVYNLVCTTLGSSGYPVREQGTYGPDESLPDTHITYFIQDQSNESHADNAPTSQTTTVQVALYSRDPAIAQQANQILKGILHPAGFLRAGGRNLPLDPDTGHYGYTSTYNFYEMEG